MKKFESSVRGGYEAPDLRTVILAPDTVIAVSNFNNGTIDEYNFLGIYD